MAFEVQQLGFADWRRFRDIRLRALSESPDAFGATLSAEEQFSDQDWIGRMEPADVATFVAVSEDGGDIGLTVVVSHGEHAGLYAMWVAPAARQRGIGGALVDAAIEWARKRGIGKLMLDVADGNEAAIALYTERGFRPTGRTGTFPSPREHLGGHQRELHIG